MIEKAQNIIGTDVLKISDVSFSDTFVTINPNQKLLKEDGIVIQINEGGIFSTAVISFDDWVTLKELM